MPGPLRSGLRAPRTAPSMARCAPSWPWVRCSPCLSPLPRPRRPPPPSPARPAALPTTRGRAGTACSHRSTCPGLWTTAAARDRARRYLYRKASTDASFAAYDAGGATTQTSLQTTRGIAPGVWNLQARGSCPGGGTFESAVATITVIKGDAPAMPARRGPRGPAQGRVRKRARHHRPAGATRPPAARDPAGTRLHRALRVPIRDRGRRVEPARQAVLYRQAGREAPRHRGRPAQVREQHRQDHAQRTSGPT